MAAIVEAGRALIATVTEPDPVKVPTLVDERIRRGREAKNKGAASRRLNFKFWRGQQTWWINDKGLLSFQDTVTHLNGGGKPPHRARTQRNFIHRLVENKISQATKRTPGYDVIASTSDPQDHGTASLSRKIAQAGYERWNIRRARIKAVTNALVADGGFAMPYFDPNVGPFREVTDEMGETRNVGAGEIKILVLDGNQVAWEEGCDFDDSPWWYIERAMPIAEVEKWPGYLGGKLKSDANTADLPTDRQGKHLCLVGEYLERPCPDYPRGRKLTIANDRVILPPEDYPAKNPQGDVVDEPVLHALSYTVDPEQDRDRGLVEHLIDAQRTINDSVNKLIEWKNRCLNPQMIARQGTLVDRPDDVPGAVRYYRGNDKPEWERPPQVPRELFDMIEAAKADMREIAADAQIDASPDVAARTAQTAVEHAFSGWALFLQALADFDASVMHHCLRLAQQHYTEPRLMQARGTLGWEPIEDFRGAQLGGQIDVRVLPESLEPRTRAGIRQDIGMLLQNFPGMFEPHAVAAALHGGLAEDLIQDYERDVERAYRMVKLFKQGPEMAMAMPPQPDGTPGWMPRPQDDISIHKQVVGSYMKSEEYDLLPEPVKEIFNLYYGGLDDLEMQRAMRQAQLQTQIAEQNGLQNAAKAPAPKALPSGPAPVDG